MHELCCLCMLNFDENKSMPDQVDDDELLGPSDWADAPAERWAGAVRGRDGRDRSRHG